MVKQFTAKHMAKPTARAGPIRPPIPRDPQQNHGPNIHYNGATKPHQHTNNQQAHVIPPVSLKEC